MRLRGLIGRAVKALIIFFAIVSICLIARYLHIQNQIKNTPIEISQYSDSGYTPPSVYGHGNLISADGTFGWYIYDIADAEHGVRKACVNNVKPQPDWDIDFVYSDGQWYKLRSGLGRISADGFNADPPTEAWKGFLSTQLTFPVRKPDLPYREKILFSKLKNGTQSPLDYIQGLQVSNPTCSDIPKP